MSAFLDGCDPGTFSGICASILAIVALAGLIGHDIYKHWNDFGQRRK